MPQTRPKSLREMIENRLSGDRRWYSISNAHSDVAEIRIYDEIGWFGLSAQDFVAELDEITAPEIVVAINSLGGSVFDGIAITNALRLHDAHVTTRVDSMAASIASVVLQAGDVRQVVDSGQVMIHEAFGLTIGTADDMREMADLLDKQTDVIAGIYAERSGKPAAEFKALMTDESWFNASEAVDTGLADEVIKPSSKTPDPETEARARRLSDHIASVVSEAGEVTERIAEVVTLRRDQGKPTDDSWRTRDAVDGLAAALNHLNDALTESEGDDTSDPESESDLAALLAAEHARFIHQGANI